VGRQEHRPEGRPVVLCGSAVPEQYERCPERRYFTMIHTLALVCDDDELVRRLQNRRGWRKSSDPQTNADMLAFDRWFKEGLDFLGKLYYNIEYTKK
jgi:hypothetical protein